MQYFKFRQYTKKREGRLKRASYKNRKKEKISIRFRFYPNFFNLFLKKITFSCSLSMKKKNQIENPEKNAKKSKNQKKCCIFFDFRRNFFFFFFFRKRYVLVRRLTGENRNENQDKNKPVKTGVFTGFREIIEKTYKKIGISGIKRYCQKGIPGISESVKNSILKAISDETR